MKEQMSVYRVPISSVSIVSLTAGLQLKENPWSPALFASSAWSAFWALVWHLCGPGTFLGHSSCKMSGLTELNPPRRKEVYRSSLEIKPVCLQSDPWGSNGVLEQQIVSIADREKWVNKITFSHSSLSASILCLHRGMLGYELFWNAKFNMLWTLCLIYKCLTILDWKLFLIQVNFLLFSLFLKLYCNFMKERGDYRPLLVLPACLVLV